MFKLIFASLLVILLIVFGWHLLFPILGGVIVITMAIWGLIIGSIVIFSVVVLLVFIFGGLGAFILGTIFALWTLIAIILFPVLFPILLPLFIIFLFITAYRRRQNFKRMDSRHE